MGMTDVRRAVALPDGKRGSKILPVWCIGCRQWNKQQGGGEGQESLSCWSVHRWDSLSHAGLHRSKFGPVAPVPFIVMTPNTMSKHVGFSEHFTPFHGRICPTGPNRRVSDAHRNVPENVSRIASDPAAPVSQPPLALRTPVRSKFRGLTERLRIPMSSRDWRAWGNVTHPASPAWGCRVLRSSSVPRLRTLPIRI